MKTKVTLTLEKSLVEEAKERLKAQGQSLSGSFERFLKAVISVETLQGDTDDWKDELLPEVHALIGIAKTPNQDERPYKEILQEELLKKYGGQ